MPLVHHTRWCVSRRRVLHGTTNAVYHLQSFLSHNLPRGLCDGIPLWEDDCLFLEETIDDLFRDLRAFLTFCREWHWLLNTRKCNLFRLETRWCGRIIFPKDIRHDPANLDGLVAMECPVTGSQLQQFLCAMQWIRSAIPNFQALINDLREFMERIYAQAGKRTKRAVSRISLTCFG